MSGTSLPLADGIKEIPPVTRFFTVVTLFVCFLTSLTSITSFSLLFSVPMFIEDWRATIGSLDLSRLVYSVFQVFRRVLEGYRLFTSFFTGGFPKRNGASVVLNTYFFYTFSSHLESLTGKFRGNFPDYLWFVLVCGGTEIVLSSAYNLIFDYTHLHSHYLMLLSSVVYLWSRQHKNSNISFLGLVPIKAYYLPLFNLGFDVISSGFPGFLDTATGIFTGYLYQCIASDTLPFYNLVPGAYPQYQRAREASSSGRRVGSFASLNNSTPQDFIHDSIFDKGYLKAPLWLYNLLKYPTNNSKRTTAFTTRPTGSSTSSATSSALAQRQPFKPAANEHTDIFAAASSTGVSWFGKKNTLFKGEGRRLGS